MHVLYMERSNLDMLDPQGLSLDNVKMKQHPSFMLMATSKDMVESHGVVTLKG